MKLLNKPNITYTIQYHIHLKIIPNQESKRFFLRDFYVVGHFNVIRKLLCDMFMLNFLYFNGTKLKFETIDQNVFNVFF